MNPLAKQDSSGSIYFEVNHGCTEGEGASSKAIRDFMLGSRSYNPAYPEDAADFGRCLRLLNNHPDWTKRMPEMAQCSRVWADLVENGNWEMLTKLYYDEELDEVAKLKSLDPSETRRKIKEIISNAEIKIGSKRPDEVTVN